MDIVDAHVHLWDLQTNPALYPELLLPEDDAPQHDVDLGDFARLCNKNYLLPEYQRDTSAFNITKMLHVSAVTPAGAFRRESEWIVELAESTNLPTGFIGSVDLGGSRTTLQADIETQAASDRFRGVRVLFGMDPTAAISHDLLSLLTSGEWVFDLVASTSSMPAFRELAGAFPSLKIVLEHAGWPEGTSGEEFERWKRALTDLARLDNVECKVSGIGMVTHSSAVDALRPWVETCIESFGIERCMFASNFPIDSLYGSYDELVNAYLAMTAALSDAERELFFVANATRVYQL